VQDLDLPVPVSESGRQRRVARQVDGPRGGLADLGGDLGDHRRQIDRAKVVGEPARLELRHGEEVIEEVFDALGVAMDRRQEIGHLRRVHLCHVALQHLGQACDDRGRGADVVDGHRGEFPLGPFALLSVAQLLSQYVTRGCRPPMPDLLLSPRPGHRHDHADAGPVA